MSTPTVEIPTHQQVLTFVSKPRKMLIGGKWLEAASGKTFPTYNPATGETLAHVAEGNSADVDKAHRIAAELRAGSVWIICYNIFDATLPFGGYKQSGWGREMGHDALELYTEVKAVTMRI